VLFPLHQIRARPSPGPGRRRRRRSKACAWCVIPVAE
jgi:hypothetical protein